MAAVAALAHCNTTDRTRRSYLRANAERLGAPPRPVIVIAGFGVTRLVDPVTGRHVWGTPRSVWRNQHPDDLDLDEADRLEPQGWAGSRGPINTGWQLAIALRKYGGYTLDRDLHHFYYDWRRSARDNARRLAELVERVRGDGSVDLVTHSAGALVAIAYLHTTMRAPVENLVMVAPPRHGAIEAFRLFIRPERFIRRTFDAELVATWPFVFELLPADGRVFIDEDGKPLDRDLWDPRTWPVDVTRQLAAGRAFVDEIRTAALPPHVKPLVLAGDCVPTTHRVLARRDGTYAFFPGDLRPEDTDLADILFQPGDGTLPVSTTRGEGPSLLFCDGHQGLAADPSVHRAVIRALRF